VSARRAIRLDRLERLLRHNLVSLRASASRPSRLLTECRARVRPFAARSGRAIRLEPGTGTHRRHRLRYRLPDALAARRRCRSLSTRAPRCLLARTRVSSAEFARADVPPLPFPDGAFDLAFSSNVYSHIGAAAARAEFVAEALRVAHTFVVLEQGCRPGRERESREPRRLLDGSEHCVFKRHFTAAELARELDGVVILASAEFLAVRTPA
jgi:hypothetical protein